MMQSNEPQIHFSQITCFQTPKKTTNNLGALNFTWNEDNPHYRIILILGPHQLNLLCPHLLSEYCHHHPHSHPSQSLEIICHPSVSLCVESIDKSHEFCHQKAVQILVHFQCLLHNPNAAYNRQSARLSRLPLICSPNIHCSQLESILRTIAKVSELSQI